MTQTEEATRPDPADVEPPRPRRRWPRRVGLTLLLLVMLIGAMLWGANRRAAHGIAKDLASYRAAGEPASVEELNQWPFLRGGSGDNAVPLLRAAGAGLDPAPVFKAAADALHAPPLDDAELAALRALVSSQAEVLAKLDEASACGRVDWDPHFTSPVMAGLAPPADLQQQMAVAQLLEAAALAAHARGDDADALRRIGQMRFIGAALDYQPSVISHLVAITCEVRAGRAATGLAPWLRVGDEPGAAPRAQVRELVASLLDESPPAAGLRRMFVGERAMELDLPSALAAGAGAGSFAGFNVRIPGAQFFVRPFAVDNARVMARGTTFLKDTAAASADLPSFRAALAATDPMPEATKSPRRYSMATLMLPSFTRTVEQHYRALADRRLTAVCLAVRLYALDHGGALPEKLDDLVPNYLPSVPLDPLAAGTTLRYVNDKADRKRPRVYSVGPDGADDGGIDPPAEPARGRVFPFDQVRDLKPQAPMPR